MVAGPCRRTSSIEASPTEHPAPRKPTGAELSGMGISIAVALIVPLVLGVVVDNFLKSSPFGVLIGLLVGVIASCYTAFAQFRRYI